jgi:uncharacterized protein YjbJ (UPF0337 family)
MNKDEIKGKFEQVKGKAKKAAGDLTDDEDLYGQGEADEVRGELREGAGRARRKMSEALENAGGKLKR